MNVSSLSVPRQLGRTKARYGRLLVAWWAIAWIAAVMHPCGEAFAAQAVDAHRAEHEHHSGHGEAQHHSHPSPSERESHCPQLTDLDLGVPQLATTLLDGPKLFDPSPPSGQVATLARPNTEPQSFPAYHPPPPLDRCYLRTLRLRI